MSTALQDYCNIWRVTTVQRDHRSGTVMALLAGLLLLAFAVLVAVDVAKHHALNLLVMLRILVGGAAVWLGLVWSLIFLPGSVMLNSVANARLLPLQRRRLVQMMAAGWLLTTAAFAAALANWTVVPAIGMFALGFALMGAGNRHAVVLVVLVGNGPWLARILMPDAAVEFLRSDTFMMVLAVLLLPALAWSLRWTYPAGGDAHFERRAVQLKQIRRYESKGWAEKVESANPSGWNILNLYTNVLRRDCRRPEPGRMLMHALGPVGHWSSWGPALLVMLAVGIGVRLLLIIRGSQSLEDFVHGAYAGGMGGFIFATVFGTAQISQQMGRMRVEQALLRLTPLAGDTRLLNRRLAVQFLRNGLGLWGLLTTTVLLVTVLITLSPADVLRQLALCCLAGQIGMMGLLGDYAGSGGWRGSPWSMPLGELLGGGSGWNMSLALRAGLLALVEGGACLALGLKLGGTIGALALIAIAVTGGVLQVRHAWKNMLAAAPAFPARRFD